MFILMTSLCACLALAPAAPQTGCPHARATFVKGSTVNSGGQNCRRGITLFGTRVGGTGEFCPRAKFTYPDHDRCLGEPAPHYRCVSAGLAAILVQFCRCVEIGEPPFEIEFGQCHCDPPLYAGGIYTDATVPCRGGR